MAERESTLSLRSNAATRSKIVAKKHEAEQYHHTHIVREHPADYKVAFAGVPVSDLVQR